MICDSNHHHAGGLQLVDRLKQLQLLLRPKSRDFRVLLMDTGSNLGLSALLSLLFSTWLGPRLPPDKLCVLLEMVFARLLLRGKLTMSFVLGGLSMTGGAVVMILG